MRARVVRFSPAEIEKIRRAMEPEERAAAEARMRAGGVRNFRGGSRAEKGRVLDRIGELCGVSGRHVEKIAEVYKDVKNFLYLGRGYNFPAALEGALKLKEISYIHAEGYPAAEMKHGPIALIDDSMPVVFIAPHDAAFDKLVSNIQEVRARHGKTIVITSRDEPALQGLIDYEIRVPETIDMLTPVLASIPLQLLAYYIAVKRGANVDQPRNLAKSVTVE